MNVDEFNRLHKLGLDPASVLHVLEGKVSEAEALRVCNERKAARAWGNKPANRKRELVPKWDHDPTKFHLSLDGEEPDVFDGDPVVLIEADIEEVEKQLTYVATRDVGPWHQRHKSKSAGIAYRWDNDLPVTPPLLVRLDNSEFTLQGMHRYHLAKHYCAKRMPFLVYERQRDAILRILSSARRIARK